MWKKYCSVLTTAVFINSIAMAAMPETKVVIDLHRNFPKGTFKSSKDWKELNCNINGCEIKNSILKITSATEKNVVNEDEALDVLNVEGQPIALFQGVPIQLGKVPTGFVVAKESYSSKQYTSLEKLGKWQMPWGSQPISIYWVKLPSGGGYRYHITNGINKQFLFSTDDEGHYGGSTTPIIHWVGDLDGDQKVDFLLSLPDDNCGFNERLYLSSFAKDNKLVGLAAVLEGAEAACGC